MKFWSTKESGPSSTASSSKANSAAAMPPHPETKAKRVRVKFATFADATTDAALSPEHPFYVAHQKRERGSVPPVIATDDMSQFAIVSSSCLRAEFRVPFGWHVLERDHRALILHPHKGIYIRISGASRDPDAQAEAGRRAEEELRELANPASSLEFHPVESADPSKRPRVQAHVLSASHHREDAARLTELIVRSLNFNSFPQPEERATDSSGNRSPKAKRKAMVEALKANGSVDLVRHEAILAAESERRSPEIPKETLPDWWQRALDLEVRGQLVDAEQLIQSNVPHLGCAASIAEMYRLRMNRLKEAGNETSAVEAFHKADYWIWNYASMATSGGEGAALSLQRDRFRTQLVAELGYDPKPVE